MNKPTIKSQDIQAHLCFKTMGDTGTIMSKIYAQLIVTDHDNKPWYLKGKMHRDNHPPIAYNKFGRNEIVKLTCIKCGACSNVLRSFEYNRPPAEANLFMCFNCKFKM